MPTSKVEIAEARKELNAEKRQVRVEEAADAVICILEDRGCNTRGVLIQKKKIYAIIGDQIENNRRCWKGTHYPPTIISATGATVEIKVADAKFCRGQWKHIRDYCAVNGFYIIWNPKGEGKGVRLGTLEEYMAQQGDLVNTAQGFADFHNKRSDIIIDHGEIAARLRLRLRNGNGKKEST